MSATQTPWDGATPSPSQGHDVRGGEQAAAGGAPAGGGEPSAGAPLVITVHGQPKPKGSMRHVGHGRMVEQVTGSKPWREAVKFAALETKPDAGHWAWVCTGPLMVVITYTVPRPKSTPKRVRWPITRTSGDVDKVARNCLDALVDAGVMVDDSQVVDLAIGKRFPDEGIDALPHPGAVIRVQEVTA